MGRSLSPGETGTATDLVFTPPDLAKRIIDKIKPQGEILDPCRGGGAFYNQLPEAYRHFCEITEGRPFEDFQGKVDWIITNPPWSKMRQFLLKGYQVADNIAYLVTVNHGFTKARIREAQANGFWLSDIYLVDTPPHPWPQSGFQLGVLVWKRGYAGQTNIEQL